MFGVAIKAKANDLISLIPVLDVDGNPFFGNNVCTEAAQRTKIIISFMQLAEDQNKSLPIVNLFFFLFSFSIESFLLSC